MAFTVPNTFEGQSEITAAEHQQNWDAAKLYIDTLGAGAADTSWRPIFDAMSNPIQSFTAATYVPLTASGLATTAQLVASTYAPKFFYFDDADYTLTGETPTLRLRAQVTTNTVAPAITYTFGLHEITAVAGAASQMTHTVNTTPVTGSTVAFASPSASTRNQGVTSAFAAPADGYYCLGITGSGSSAATAMVMLAGQLQVKVAD